MVTATVVVLPDIICDGLGGELRDAPSVDADHASEAVRSDEPVAHGPEHRGGRLHALLVRVRDQRRRDDTREDQDDGKHDHHLNERKSVAPWSQHLLLMGIT